MLEHPTKKCRVIKAYESDYTEPWCMCGGEQLKIGERDSEWDGWVWCINQEGESRWVPEDFMERQGDTCVALRNYESTELSVQLGEVLSMGAEESGWAWCTKDADKADQAGESGWVPLECLEIL
ncbi:MAG: hypothetical protein ISS57_15715 [Anaerolineales bacterium]|nr:hypothetical protein [Anaerolineales bacterium]